MLKARVVETLMAQRKIAYGGVEERHVLIGFIVLASGRDALGAASHEGAELKRFMRSREIVLQLLTEKAEGVLGDINAQMITTFTFNDTILIILRTGTEQPRSKQILDFFKIVRKFLVDSLAHGILFRGSISIGTFYAKDETNTVMGQAVTRRGGMV